MQEFAQYRQDVDNLREERRELGESFLNYSLPSENHSESDAGGNDEVLSQFPCFYLLNKGHLPNKSR